MLPQLCHHPAAELPDGLPSAPSPLVAIIIPVFNQLAFTRQCLESLHRHHRVPSEAIVIDNGSTDGTGEYLSTDLQLELIRNSKNLGCAAAWNQGVKASAAEWVAILNNDVVLTAGWLEGLLAAASDEGLDIVSPALREGPLNYDLEPYAREFIQTTGQVTRPGVAHGICFLVRRRVFDVIGWFDENFRIGQFEDADFFQRAQRAGFKLGATGRSFIHHFGSVTQNSIRQAKAASPYEAQNRVYYRKKWGLTWPRRHLQRLQTNLRLAWWRARERRQYGHSLNERWLHGQLLYH